MAELYFVKINSKLIPVARISRYMECFCAFNHVVLSCRCLLCCQKVQCLLYVDTYLTIQYNTYLLSCINVALIHLEYKVSIQLGSEKSLDIITCEDVLLCIVTSYNV